MIYDKTDETFLVSTNKIDKIFICFVKNKMKIDNEVEEILNRHREYSNQINSVWVIQNFLIDEFHKKKCNKKNKPLTDLANKYYRNYLFFGEKKLWNYNTLIYSFKSPLDSLLYKEISTHVKNIEDWKKYDLATLYYGNKDLTNIELNIWSLSDDTNVTKNDELIMENFKTLIDNISKSFMLLIKNSLKEKEYKNYQREHVNIMTKMFI